MGEERKRGSWFLIMVSWEAGDDEIAVKRFNQVYMYLNVRNANLSEAERKQAVADYNRVYDGDQIFDGDPVFDIVIGSLKPFNLIGRRKFVIIFQTPSNRVLQRLSKMISLYTRINVEIFPATYVTELGELLLEKK